MIKQQRQSVLVFRYSVRSVACAVVVCDLADRTVAPAAVKAIPVKRIGAALLWIMALGTMAGRGAIQTSQTTAAEGSPENRRQLVLTTGKAAVVDSPANIQRVSIANPKLAEAIAVSPREVVVNALVPGETSMILWQQGGPRVFYDLVIQPGTERVEAARRQLAAEFPDQDVTLTFDNETPFLRGTVNNLTGADRAVAIASTLGKPVNLLHVMIPPVDPQILLKVRFANVDRAVSQELGVNLFSTGALNTPGQISTGQFSPPRLELDQQRTGLTLSDALNVFLLRPDLNLGATIRALQARRALEILAEPNVLTINGKPASFVAGGEFPFPTLQGGGAGLGAVTIQFREFGVRIAFTPNVTPRNTIRLQVVPEVSSLDFANGLIFQGFSIPALSTRRVATEIELEAGQSFAIAGLLDNRLSETLYKIPGLSAIPLLGKLFQSKALSRNNSELLVLVTPELVRPIPAGQPLPEVLPREFLDSIAPEAPRTPGLDETGPVPVSPSRPSLPVEELIRIRKADSGPQQTAAPPQFQFVPVLTPSVPGQPPAPAESAPAAAPQQQ
jgi:pilus assembly protein CpaC